MSNLLAVCRLNDALQIRHVQLTNDLLEQINGIFAIQEADFLAGIDAEIDFNGDWKPDNNELLVIRDLVL